MKKLKLGLIGVGRLGIVRASIISNLTNASLYAVCDNDIDRLDKVSDEFGLKSHRYSDYNDMFNNCELDSVVISNSSDGHCNAICTAVNAGLHIFCEKPIALNFDEISLLRKTLKGYTKKITIGFTNRFSSELEVIREKVGKGEIGKLIFIRLTATEGINIDELDFFKKFAARCGGFIFDVGIHDLDLVNWLLNSKLTKINAFGGVFGLDYYKEINDVDNYLITMQFENGIMAELLGSRNPECSFVRELEIIGTKGIIKRRIDTLGNIVYYNNKGAVTDNMQGGMKAFLAGYNDMYTNELKDFIDCIILNKMPAVNWEEACTASEWAIKSYKSIRDKKK